MTAPLQLCSDNIYREFCDWTGDIFDRVIPLQVDWVLLIMSFTLQKTAS